MTPDWLAPDRALPGIGRIMTTRRGGASAPPWDGFNLGNAVGDAPAAVDANRAAFAEAIGATPLWLRQTHGTRLVRLTPEVATGAAPQADASLATEPGLACTVQVADCLPILYADRRGRAVAAAHAGWRGLAGGIAELTLLAVCEEASCEPAEVAVWLGACIGPARFEIGADVLQAFGRDPGRDDASGRFVARGPQHPGKWLADLAGLARDRLLAAGARDIDGGGWCTVGDASRFYSFRRDGVTGRMAAAVWLHG